MTEARDVLRQAEEHFAEGRLDLAKPQFQKIWSHGLQHRRAYGRLVEMAINDRDAAALEKLMAAHRIFLFAAPENFHVRVQYYRLNTLRKIYDKAAQAFVARRWETAKQGFSQLLAEDPFHPQAVDGLFRVAMKQKDYARA